MTSTGGADGSAAVRMRVVITGGGYGGHVCPAVAVGERLLRSGLCGEIDYIGNPRCIERDILRRTGGFRLHEIIVSEMPRRPTLRFLPWAGELPGALWGALRHLRRIRPRIIFSTGAFVSVPVVCAGAILRIPSVVHEADVAPGLANKVAARLAMRTTLGYPEPAASFPSGRAVVTGNPIRSGFRDLPSAEARSRLGLDPDLSTLLVLGGSLGARSVNEVIGRIARPLIEKGGLQIIHATGTRHWTGHRAAIGDRDPSLLGHSAYLNVPYLEDVPTAMAAASLAVSRAGSSSLAEFHRMGTPALLIPYPKSHLDHQLLNARALEARGAALCVEERDLRPDALLRSILRLLADRSALDRMRTATRGLCRPDAADRIVDVIRGLLDSRRGPARSQSSLIE